MDVVIDMQQNVKKWWPLAIVLVGTVGLLAYIISDAFFSELENPILSIRLFKYFTMLANLLAVVYFWLIYSMRMQIRSRTFDHFIGGVVMYLFVTFVIYAILLEGDYESQGLDLIGNVALHYLNPLLVIVYYGVFRKDYKFENKDIAIWFVFPIAYLVFLVLHGVVTDDYLYPFFQVAEVGVTGLISMIAILVGVFFLLSFILVKMVSPK